MAEPSRATTPSLGEENEPLLSPGKSQPRKFRARCRGLITALKAITNQQTFLGLDQSLWFVAGVFMLG